MADFVASLTSLDQTLSAVDSLWNSGRQKAAADFRAVRQQLVDGFDPLNPQSNVSIAAAVAMQELDRVAKMTLLDANGKPKSFASPTELAALYAALGPFGGAAAQAVVENPIGSIFGVSFVVVLVGGIAAVLALAYFFGGHK